MFSLPSNPLFSSIITLYFLILLYFPHIFFQLVILISPVLISTLFLLLFLLRLGASQQLKSKPEPKPISFSYHGLKPEPEREPEPKPVTVFDQGRVAVVKPHCNRVETQQSVEPGPRTQPEPVLFDQSKEQIDSRIEEETSYGLGFGLVDPQCHYFDKPEPSPETQPEPVLFDQSKEQIDSRVEEETIYGTGFKFEPGPQWNYLDRPEPGPSPVYQKFFLEWEVGAPLAVIYEGEEEDDDEDKDKNDEFDQENSTAENKRYYPSLSRYYPESDSDLDSDSESYIDKWDEEEDREGLIEIALDYNGNRSNKQGMVKLMEFVYGDDEDNLIEIDI